jgi:hypothetical protein
MCRAKTRCGWCASETHTTKLHTSTDKSKHRCANCKGNHAAFSRDCKEHKKEVDRVKAERKRLQFEPMFPAPPTITPSVSVRGSRPSSNQGETPRSPTPLLAQPTINTPTSIAADVEMENGTPEERVGQPEPSEESEESEAELPKLFTETPVPPPQPRTPFKAPHDMNFDFGMTTAPTMDPKTPGIRKFKEAVRKIQSSPLKLADDGNISDGYTTVTGKKGKRAAKKNHVESLSKAKQSRLRSSGRLGEMELDIEMEIQESETVAFADPTGTGSAPESAGESSSEVSSSSSEKSSSVDSPPTSTVARNTPAPKRST